MRKKYLRKLHKLLACILSVIVVNMLFFEQKVNAIKDVENKENLNEVVEISIKDEFITTDTFLSNGGEYSIWHLLGNYNIFSFKDIFASHVVGPVITKEKAYHLSLEHAMAISDLSKGISSYVGELNKGKVDSHNATFKLDYGHEYTNPGFVRPNFYIRENQIVSAFRKEGRVYFKNTKEEIIVNPNSSPDGVTFLNNNYVDFLEAKEKFLKDSLELLNVQAEEVSPNLETGYLELHVGQNYKITNANKLRSVNFIYPSGYDPYINPYPIETIINIEEDTLAQSGTIFQENTFQDEDGKLVTENKIILDTIAGKKCQFFPKIYVNGKVFSGGENGPYGTPNYGDFNNIVWNMPNIKTVDGVNRLVPISEISILGHIVAPKVQFFNIKKAENGGYTWSGGNINGAAIVDSWYGGGMEMHYYPFKKFNYGDELPSTGGSGEHLFKGLGILLMMSSLLILKRRQLN